MWSLFFGGGNKKDDHSQNKKNNDIPDPPAMNQQANEEKRNGKKKNKNQHHSLYGTMITIESPRTTPKVSHVSTTKHFAKQKLHQRQQQDQYLPTHQKQKQTQQQQSSSSSSPLHQSNSMPDMDDYDNATNNHHEHHHRDDPLKQPLMYYRRYHKEELVDNNHKEDNSDLQLEKDNDGHGNNNNYNDDDNNSLSAASYISTSSYSDIRPSLYSATKNKRRTASSRDELLLYSSMRSSTSTIGSLQSIITQSVASVVDATFRLPGKPSSIRDVGGTASMSNEIFNLIKNIVGAGAFGLPRGVAAFANEPSALYPSALCVIAMGGVFGYYFLLMGRICSSTSTASYREAWDETAGIYRNSNLDIAGGGGGGSCCTPSGIMGAVVPLFIVFMAGLGNLAYNMILADTCKSLLGHIGVHVSRTQCLIGTTVCILLPLCMVQRLSRLAPFSIVGLIGIIFTIGAVVWRYYDGSYEAPTTTTTTIPESMSNWQNQNQNQFTSINITGVSLQQRQHANASDTSNFYWSQVPESMQPLFGTVGAIGAFSGNFLILACMCFQSYFCHYNAPRYYIELKDNTIHRFTLVTVISFTVCIVLYIVIMTYGFLTFGEHSDGFLLNNYADEDTLITLCRFLIAIALAFTYPLPFIGVRDGLLDLLMVPSDKRTSNNLNVLTLILLSIFCFLAMQFTDVGIVNAVGGGIGGAAVVFVFPALMFRHVVYDLGIHAGRELRLEAKFGIALMWLGIAMGGIGAYMGIQAVKQEQ